MKDNTKRLKINGIDINKIRVSEQIDIVVIEKDVVGYYSVYNDSKKMNFRLNDKL